MVKPCLLLVLLLNAGVAHAVQDTQPFCRFYVGTIGAWDLRWTVDLSASRVQGHLRSAGVPGPLRVSGPALVDNRLDCQVADGRDHVLGRLHGRFTAERGFAGTFIPADGKAPMVVAADEMAEFQRTETMQGPWYRLTATWPVFSEAHPLLARLNSVLPGEMRRLDDEFLGPPADRRNAIAPMTQDGSVEVIHCSPRLVSLLVSRYTYTGGAHGNTDFLPLTWMWADGAPFHLDLADLFTDAKAMIEVKARCAEDLIRQGASEAAQVEAKPDAFFKTFCVSRNGLGVQFAPYAVGSYAEGSFHVTIPWSRLTRFIDPHGPLAELLLSDAGNEKTPVKP